MYEVPNKPGYYLFEDGNVYLPGGIKTIKVKVDYINGSLSIVGGGMHRCSIGQLHRSRWRGYVGDLKD